MPFDALLQVMTAIEIPTLNSMQYRFSSWICSHIHQNVTMRFLHCEPNFNKLANYLDEADSFYANPASWIRSHFPVYPKTALPSHVILFDNLQSRISDFLANYKQIHSFFHADVSTWSPSTFIQHFQNQLMNGSINPQLQFTTDRVGGNVLIFERTRDDVKTTEREPAVAGTNAFNSPQGNDPDEL